MSLSRVVWSGTGERLYSFEQAALLTQTSVTVLEGFANLGLIEPVGVMLRSQDLLRVVQILRLRRDLGLNLAGPRWYWIWQEKLLNCDLNCKLTAAGKDRC